MLMGIAFFAYFTLTNRLHKMHINMVKAETKKIRTKKSNHKNFALCYSNMHAKVVRNCPNEPTMEGKGDILCS